MKQPALLLIGLALVATGCQTGCKSQPGESGQIGVPNLSQVEPGVWRGGQPSAAGWAHLRHNLGLTNIVKLNPMEEGSDRPGVDNGMRITAYCPLSTMEMLVKIDPESRSIVNNAVWHISPGTFVHCEHGQDRTGLVIGLYRLREGTNKAAAYQEMLNHGFHPALRGLKDFWEDAQ